MRRFNTRGIILTRTNFGEADRIITFLTPDHGKLKGIAKGVRKSKSKLAGGLEIFSVSQIMVLPGKNEINTVMSARLEKHYGNIVKNVERTQTAYESMRLINKVTQEKPEAGYFNLLETAFAIIDGELDFALCDLWFKAQLIKLSGHMPNLRQDASGQRLKEASAYKFDLGKMCFNPDVRGSFSTNDVKFLRLVFAAANPGVLTKIQIRQPAVQKPGLVVESVLKTAFAGQV